MNKWDGILLLATALSVLCAAAVIIINQRKTRSTLLQINAMLNAAMDGTFREQVFDESLLSSMETRFAHYLSAQAVSARYLAEEKDRIKELIADISHQTKTPVANILLYAQLLREQRLPAESTSCVAELNMQAEKLSFLIDSLVKISRLETGVFELHPKMAEVEPMLEDILKQVMPKANAKNILICCKPVEALACFDRKWTTEAVYNIVDNAVKYTPGGGCIQIQATAYHLFLKIDITDNGIGIEEYELARIFGRFYRSAAVRDTEGVGIGLYLSRRIISEQGGYIKVSSSPGAGTTFSVFLPV